MSVTVIVQLLYVPSDSCANVILLSAATAVVVLEEQLPPYVIAPASFDVNV